MSDWRAEIKRRAEAHPGGLAGIGREIGITRQILSGLVNRNYKVSERTLARFEMKVIAWLGQEHLVCPYLRERITEGDCSRYRDRRRPKADPAGLRHWHHCRECGLGRALAERQAKQKAEQQAGRQNAAPAAPASDAQTQQPQPNQSKGVVNAEA